MAAQFMTAPAASRRGDRPAIELLEVRRLLSAGSLDPTFGIGGTAFAELFPGGTANACAAQSDGKIIAAGQTAQSKDFALARFNPDGSLDRTFANKGRAITKFSDTALIDAIAIQPDGKIVAAGSTTLFPPAGSSVVRFAVARYLPDGRLDSTFGSRGTTSISFTDDDFARAVVVQTDGKIVVAGGAVGNNGAEDFALVRLNSNGALDKKFGSGGKVRMNFGPTATGEAEALVVQPNGDLVAGGYVQPDVNTTDAAIVRYLPNGSLDRAFGSSGIVMSNVLSVASTLALQPDGRIMAGGQDSNGQLAVARFTVRGAADPTFGVKGVASVPNPPNSQNASFASAVLLRKGGGVIVVGSAPTYTTGSPVVARFTSAGVLDKTFGPTASGIVDIGSQTANAALQQADGKIVIVGGTGASSLDFALCRFTAAGQRDNSFGFEGSVTNANGITGPIKAIAVQHDGKIVVAGSENAPDPSLPAAAALARYNPDGTLDTSFGADGRSFVRIGNAAVFNALLVQSNGELVAGGYGNANSNRPTVFAVVRFRADGTLDRSFGSAGQFVTSFAGSIGQQCNGIAQQANGDLVAAGRAGGGIYDGPAGSQMAVIRLLPNGQLDPRFGAGGKLLLDPLSPFSDGAIATAVALQKDGRVVLGGNIGVDFGVLRLRTNGSLDPTFGDGGAVAVALDDTSYDLPDQGNALEIDTSGRIILGGSVGNESTSSELALLRFRPNGSLDPTFGNAGDLLVPAADGYSNHVDAIALQPDGRIVFGGIVNDDQWFVARATDKGLDRTFGAGGISTQSGTYTSATAMALLPDGRIITASGSDLLRLTAR